MSVSKEEVKHLAKLSRLEFNDKALDKITNDLSSIVDFANQLAGINVEGIKPTAHILDIKNVFREDNVNKSYDREVILKNAPEKEAGCVSVPQTVE